jgi:hypothetical protein
MTSDAIDPRDAAAAQTPARHANRPKRFLSRSAQAKRYGKSKRTIMRWGRDPKMNMPEETWLNNMPHRDEAELETWEAQQRGKRI